MAGLALTSEQSVDVTVISNNFIDNYMCSANGEFVKIYLYLLRCNQQMPQDFSLQLIADRMNIMDSDVLRALHYWEQQGLLKLISDEKNMIQSLLLTMPGKEKLSHISRQQASGSTTIEAAPTVKQPVSRTANPEVLQELALIAEQYLKRPLTSVDLSKIAYFYEDLHFSEALIEYLLEHCVSIGNRSIRYIESVAASWADKGITTIEQAKAEGQHFRREYFQIIKAFGIRNRTPVDSEVEYMKRWLDEYHFTVDVICEACQRTVAKTGNPVFAYADSILKNWKEHGVLAKRDIAALDNAHHARQQAQQIAATRERAITKSTTATKFSNFEQRGEYDFNQLEKQLNAT